MELNGCPVACLKYMRKQMYLRNLGCCFYMNFKYIWLILVLNQHIWYRPTEKRCQQVPNIFCAECAERDHTLSNKTTSLLQTLYLPS